MNQIFNRIQYALVSLLTSCILICTSCEKDTIDLSDPSQAINSISTSWGSSMADIRKHMKGYVEVKDNGDDIIIYRNEKGENHVAYKFINGKLSASILISKNLDETSPFDEYLRSYQYIGNINNDMIYQSQAKNTMATTKTVFTNKDYTSIGFAPLVSDEYEKVVPYGVTTEADITILPTKVTLHGTVQGLDKEAEVGFMLSLSPEMNDSDCRVATMKSSGGGFVAELSGILDQEKYYYRAYAIIDDIPYYGEVQSFETEPLTYTINGKEFKVIKVEGGPYGTISVLQTEISAKDELVFAGMDEVIIPDSDRVDGNISLYESKKLIGRLLTLTGLAWRYPTSAEWEFLASGGLHSKQFTYSGSDDINEVAWYEGNCSGPMSPGLKEANELGLYDMSGNYAEISNDKPIKNLEANIYLTGDYYDWDKKKVHGGNWSSKASECKPTSKVTPKELELNLIEGKKYAFRLVYSHHIKAYVYY